MSTSIQATPSAAAGVQQSKLSTADSAKNPANSDGLDGFTAVFASYVETDPKASAQQVDENLTELLAQLLPQATADDGNTLPQADEAAMWQALMLIQPAEQTLTNTPTQQVQALGLLDGQRKPVLSTAMSNQDYFNTLAMQSKQQGDGMPLGMMQNKVSTQLAAAHFIPENRESILFNMNEQLVPIQNTNSNIAQGFAAVGLGTATQAAATQTHMAPLNLGQNAWESNLGSRLQMMIGQNIQSAEIRLDPPELGALDVKIKVTNDVATVNITSAHSHVREALETAVPRLREMFAESGLSLGDVNVRQESFAGQQNTGQGDGSGGTAIAENEFGEEVTTVSRKIVSDSLLDAYA